MSSKNDPTTRKKATSKTFNGQPVIPVLYDGKAIGHGKYMAGSVRTDDGKTQANRVTETIKDENGRPIPLRSIQYDKYAPIVEGEGEEDAPKKLKGELL